MYNIRINKNSAFILIGLMLVLTIALQAQNATPDTMWTKVYDGEGYRDEGLCVQQTSDKGYIIVGAIQLTEDAITKDVWLIKTNENGDTLWTRTFGDENFDMGHFVQQTSDGGYIITGIVDYVSGDGDVWLIKTDEDGNLVWDTRFGGDGYECGFCVQQTTDLGYIVVGVTGSDIRTRDSDILLVKFDQYGELEWYETYGDENGDEGQFVKQTSDEGYVVTGSCDSWDKVALLKTDPEGNLEWFQKLLGAVSEGYSLDITTDERYIVTGYYCSWDRLFLLKADKEGNQLWCNTFGLPGYYDEGRDVQQTQDGGYIVVGSTRSYGAGGYDIWLLKTNEQGDLEWDKEIGGESDDLGYSLDETTDGGYIVVGATYSFGNGSRNVYLIKTEPQQYFQLSEEWNWISFNVHPEDTSISSVFGPPVCSVP